MRRGGVLLAALLFPLMTSAQEGVSARESVSVYAAGSLRAVLTELGEAFRKQSGTEVKFTFGASGLLKERIEKGEAADVFASANTGHPAALAKTGLAGEPRVFTRNELCAIAAPKVSPTPDNLLDLMLDPAIKLGTSTPKADPSGDYAWLAFERAEKVRPGSFAKLDAKALKLTGGKDSPPPNPGRNVYAELVAGGQADVFLTYCTNAALASKEEPTLKRVALPASLAVGADYGLAVLKRAGPKAQTFADYLLSPDAQRVLAAHGFMTGGK